MHSGDTIEKDRYKRHATRSLCDNITIHVDIGCVDSYYGVVSPERMYVLKYTLKNAPTVYTNMTATAEN